MKYSQIQRISIPVMAFMIAFYFIPLIHLGYLALMPGNIGDARLNNYFLENIYQFFFGGANSLWHLSFFYPFPYVLGFSDNLFGSAPLYLVSRLVTGETDTAFQIWFLLGYVANFFAAYYALRRLKGSVLGSTIGAVIFAFALPTTAHDGHAQLHYRFGIPLAIVFFVEFLNSKLWRWLIFACAWLVWQFYAGVYMGFFTLLMISAMGLVYLRIELFNNKISINTVCESFLSSWREQPAQQKMSLLVGAGFLFFMLILLFYPYLQVTHLYGAKRSWGEIASMLPRPQSYFLSDASFFWTPHDSRVFAGIPMRHEHQMFIGVVPMFLALLGFFVGNRAKCGETFTLMTGMLGVVIFSTLYIHGFSIWHLFYKLPLASAIRAMTRLDQAILFPIAYLAVIAIDNLRTRFTCGSMIVMLVIFPLLILEAGMTSMSTSTKETWRQRVRVLESVVPANLPKDTILFFAQRSGPFFADELDAMWVSLRHRTKTINGYSGIYPPGYTLEYGKDCFELPRRVSSYLEFVHQSDNDDAYNALVSRIVLIGFNNCDPASLNKRGSEHN